MPERRSRGKRRRRGLKPRAFPRTIRAQLGPSAAVCTTVFVVVVPMTARAADHICSKCRTNRPLTELLPVTHFYRRQRTRALARGSKKSLPRCNLFQTGRLCRQRLKTFYRKSVVISQMGIAFRVPASGPKPSTQDDHRASLSGSGYLRTPLPQSWITGGAKSPRGSRC